MTALLNYELRITMAMNYTEEKIEMICGRKMKVTTEIQMSTEVKTLLESDPKAAAQFRDVVDALEAERRAEMEKKMEKPVSVEELMNKPDSEDEDEDEVREDRWNSPLPGREAKCVNLLKEIIAEFRSSLPEIRDNNRNGAYVTGIIDHSGDEFTKKEINKFGFAFNAWLILNEHKLDGLGGNWCSGCFGSFWADIALTIPCCAGVYYGCRVSFNPEPRKGKQSYFVVEINEKLKTYNPLKMLLPSTACFPEYGVQRDWGMEIALVGKEAFQAKLRAENEQRLKEEAERQAKKEEKAAKLRAENEQRRKEEEERKAKFAAERALIEQQAAAQRQAEFAAKVAALAEQEKAAKEQARLAKLEQARISEEKAKLKAQQKEAERLAKFGNKKK